MNKFYLLSMLILSSVVARAAYAARSESALCSARDSALDFVLHSQVQRTGKIYAAGEWSSIITMAGPGRAVRLLRKGPFEDPNAFTAANIQNTLAEIYSDYRKDPRIPPALALARDSFARYQTQNGGYNFWPANPLGGKDGHLPVFRLTRKAIDGLVDIPADADDTAVIFLSRLQDEKILGPENDTTLHDFQLDHLLSKYLDHGLRLPAPNNMLNGEFGTGAYLTWLEREPVIPIISSVLFPQSYGPRVVLGKNIVDCVVNANVIRTLTVLGKTDASGYHSSCEYLNAKARGAEYNTCGTYYPDTYWFHFAVARAFKDGASCLQEAVDINLKHLVDSQRADGSWHNEVLKDDDVLATTLALSALVKTGDPTNVQQKAAVDAGLARLLAIMHTDDSGDVFWPGGAFFSAGFPARTGVLWISDSVTTAFVAQILFEAQAWSKDLNCRK